MDITDDLKKRIDSLLLAAQMAVYYVRTDSECWHSHMSEKAKLAIADLDRACISVVQYKPESEQICKTCGGSGKLNYIDDYNPPFRISVGDCMTCGGTGRLKLPEPPEPPPKRIIKSTLF